MTIRKFSLLGLVGMVALLLGSTSCSNKSTIGERPSEEDTTLEIVSEINTLRASETYWHQDDEIGIYVVESGKGLAAAHIYQSAENLSYRTPNADGRFVPSTGNAIPLLDGKRVDVMGYYPYQTVGADYQVQLDVSDQSDLTKIDFLYSDNARAVDARAPRAKLVFDHVLSQLQLNVLAVDGVDLSNLKVRIGGVVTNGTFDLVKGKMASIGTATKEVTAFGEQKGGLHRAILLPGQELSALKLTFDLGGVTYTYDQLPAGEMLGGVRERFTFYINSEGLSLVDATIEVIGKGDEGSVPGIEVPGGALSVERQEITLEADDTAPHSIGVYPADGAAWTASTADSFVHLTTASGTGRGALVFTLDKNSSTTARSATIKVSSNGEGALIKIYQAGATGVAPSGYSNTASYMEQVLIKTGMMQDVQIVQHNAPDSWFAGGSTPGGQRRNYTIYYSKDNHLPYMVAYANYKDCQGNIGRVGEWEYDKEIPVNVQMDLVRKSYDSSPFNLSGDLYARGHMLMSNQRQATEELNQTTFYVTNSVPQLQNALNGAAWLSLEEKEVNWSRNAARSDTTYAVAGPILNLSNPKMIWDKSHKLSCPIPTHTFKVLLRKKGNSWISIGVKMPNELSTKGRQWAEFVCTVADLERELGVTFFPQLDPAIADQVKSQKNSWDW